MCSIRTIDIKPTLIDLIWTLKSSCRWDSKIMWSVVSNATNLTLSGWPQNHCQKLEVRRFVLLVEQSLLSTLPDKLTANNPSNYCVLNDLSNEQIQLFQKWRLSLTRFDHFWKLFIDFTTSRLHVNMTSQCIGQLIRGISRYLTLFKSLNGTPLNNLRQYMQELDQCLILNAMFLWYCYFL